MIHTLREYDRPQNVILQSVICIYPIVSVGHTHILLFRNKLHKKYSLLLLIFSVILFALNYCVSSIFIAAKNIIWVLGGKNIIAINFFALSKTLHDDCNESFSLFWCRMLKIYTILSFERYWKIQQILDQNNSLEIISGPFRFIFKVSHLNPD